MFLYLRVQGGTWQQYGLNRRSASRSVNPSTLHSSGGGVNEHCPWVTWYLSPFACLYDFMHPGVGHLKGLESSSAAAGRESVVDAPRAVDEDADPDPLPPPPIDADLCNRAPPEAEGDPERDCAGVVREL